MDVREFLAYNESFEANRINPVAHFARRGMTFPKSLLGYQPPDDRNFDDARALIVTDIPDDYLTARAVLICPMELIVQTQLIAGLKRGSTHSFILDPEPAAMTPKARRSFPALLNGVTAFLPSEEELQNLFWGETHDLWAMAEAVSMYGCDYVVVKRGAQGQLLYCTGGKRKYEIPAYPARVADPTGAGDAFCGGFLAGYGKNYDALEGVLHGNISASLKLEGSGAFYPMEVMPGLAEARLGALRGMVREV